MRNRDTIKAAVDSQPRRKLGRPGIADIPKCLRRAAEIALTGAPESTPRRASLPLISARSRK